MIYDLWIQQKFKTCMENCREFKPKSCLFIWYAQEKWLSAYHGNSRNNSVCRGTSLSMYISAKYQNSTCITTRGTKNVNKVWLISDNTEILVPVKKLRVTASLRVRGLPGIEASSFARTAVPFTLVLHVCLLQPYMLVVNVVHQFLQAQKATRAVLPSASVCGLSGLLGKIQLWVRRRGFTRRYGFCCISCELWCLSTKTGVGIIVFKNGRTYWLSFSPQILE